MRPRTPSAAVDDLPEPVRAIALCLVEDFMSLGYTRARAERQAALLCASFVAERLWDANAVIVTYVVDQR